jgi:hypothetical protein
VPEFRTVFECRIVGITEIRHENLLRNSDTTTRHGNEALPDVRKSFVPGVQAGTQKVHRDPPRLFIVPIPGLSANMTEARKDQDEPAALMSAGP